MKKVQSDIINIQLFQLVFAYIFVLILLFIVKQKEIGQKGEILLASVRMTIQLVAVGFILEYVFANQNPYYSLLILLIMELLVRLSKRYPNFWIIWNQVKENWKILKV